MTEAWTAPCEVTEKQFVPPQNLKKVPFICEALTLIPASGMQFRAEQGRDDSERTHEVYSINQNQCAAKVEDGSCPLLRAEAGAA